MRSSVRRILVPIAALVFASSAWAQLGLFSREQRIDFTREWQGERFEDGRPRVPDSILERMKTVTAEEAWGVLRGAKFSGQFEGDWKVFNQSESRLVGRAVTAIFLPIRPDVNAVVNEHGKAEGRIGAQNSWIIDILKPGDVLVADLFGEVMGINVPIRIGRTTIMPGDLVLGDPEGVVFVPPQLAEKVVSSAEMVHLRDEWGHMVLREGKYTPGQIDRRWTPQMEEEFRLWRKQREAKGK
jgi:4-hydroxy-4-methyl-2-oxoglutarate aldolase